MEIYRFISVTPLSGGCNLSCEYCYIAQHSNDIKVEQSKKNRRQYTYSLEYMFKALSVERLGGVCMFNLCSEGETLLSPNIYEITKGLLEQGHFVSIVTNATISKTIDKLLSLPSNLLERLAFKCSFHYLELINKHILEVYIKNVKKMKTKNVSYSVECVAYDGLVPYVEAIKELSLKEFGALPHILTGRSEKEKEKFIRLDTNMPCSEYRRIWSDFESDLFEFQLSDFDKTYKDYFCYAGDYSGILDLDSGNFIPCAGNALKVTNFYSNIEEKIRFTPMGKSCPLDNCFIAYAYNCLAGNCYNDNCTDYTFNDFRNRICEDGSQWINTRITNIYKQRCSDMHEELSDELKSFITSLVKVRYGQPEIYSQLQNSKLLEGWLKNHNIKKIAIYGMGRIGNWVWNLLKNSEINVVCGLDRRKDEIETDLKINGIDSLSEEVDAILVTPYYLYEDIYKDIRQIYSLVRIISVTDMLYE